MNGLHHGIPMTSLSDIVRLRMPSHSLWAWAGVAVVQLLLAAMFFLDWKLPLAVAIAGVVGVVALRYPFIALACMLGGRILATGSMSFLRIAGLDIGVFEPMLGLALAVLLARVMLHGESLTPKFPWRSAFLVFWAWQVIGVTWSYRASGAFSEVVAVGVIFTTTTLIVVFVQDYVTFEKAILAWIGFTLLTALLSITTDFTQVEGASKTWEIATKGGRETGLGQQPNWFAMNLMFGVALSFACSVTQRTAARRYLLLLVGLFILAAQLRSGSRGGTYALVIGAFIVSRAVPRVRTWIARTAAATLLVGGAWILFAEDSTSQALNRIVMNVGNTWGGDIRERNWIVCVKMFFDTWGLGVGAGGYQELVSQYDWKIYNSIHRYPHGIFWGLMGHYGLVGLGCAAWLVRTLFRMTRDLATWTRGTRAEVYTWTFAATMTGYFAWSFVEFSFDDKPFWEFMALFTALYLVVKRTRESGGELPALPGGAGLPWLSSRRKVAPAGA